MADPAEERRAKFAEASAKLARDRELARRKVLKDAQEKASKEVHRPLVGPAAA